MLYAKKCVNCVCRESPEYPPASLDRNACANTQAHEANTFRETTSFHGGRRTSNNGDHLCHRDPHIKSQTSPAKAATVTSQPQAGKSCFGSWQRKFSRSLALTSRCHWAGESQEQPHTEPLSQPSPRASVFLQDGLHKFTLPMCKSRPSSWTSHGAHYRIFKYPCPLPPHTTIFPAERPPSSSWSLLTKTPTVPAADPALSTDQYFLYSTSQSPVNLSPAPLHPPWDTLLTWHQYPLAS